MLFGPLLSFYGNDVVPLLFHKCQILHINLLLVKSFVSGGLVIVTTSSKGKVGVEGEGEGGLVSLTYRYTYTFLL